MESISIALLSSLSSVSLAALLIFLSKNWILERLRESIKHDYAVKLESYRSQITRREQAYEEIINALYDKIAFFRVQKEDYGQGTGLSEERERELYLEYIKASASLSRATDIGALFISRESVRLLEDLRDRKQLDYYNEPKFEFYEAEFDAHQRALSELLQQALVDLKRT
jgi:chaperonin cofactor prefoldin